MYPRTRFHPFARRGNPAPIEPQVAVGTPGWVPHGGSRSAMLQPGNGVVTGGGPLFDDLVDDHNKARALVAQVRSGNRGAYASLADALRRHSFAEEQTLYRTMLAVPSLVTLANANWAEHKALDAALLEIDSMSMSDPLWGARFDEMVRLLDIHLLAEEGTPGSTGTPGSIFALASAAIPVDQQALLAKQYEVLMHRKPPVPQNRSLMSVRNPDACIEVNPGTGSHYGPGRRHRSVMQNLFRRPNPAQPKPKWWRRFMGAMGLPLRTADGWYPVVSFGSPSTGGRMPFVRLSSPIEGVLHMSRGTKPLRVRVVRRRQAGRRFEVQVAPLTSASVRTRNISVVANTDCEANPGAYGRTRYVSGPRYSNTRSGHNDNYAETRVAANARRRATMTRISSLTGVGTLSRKTGCAGDPGFVGWTPRFFNALAVGLVLRQFGYDPGAIELKGWNLRSAEGREAVWAFQQDYNVARLAFPDLSNIPALEVNGCVGPTTLTALDNAENWTLVFGMDWQEVVDLGRVDPSSQVAAQGNPRSSGGQSTVQLTAPMATQGYDEWGRPILLKRSAVSRSTLPAAVLRRMR